MALGRKGLTCGAIKGLTVCCFTRGGVLVLHCKHAALHGCAVHSHAKQCAGAGKGENCFVYKSFSPPEILSSNRAPANN
ncbi:unnamed protein product, partial [Staurois parvus]